MKNWKGVAVGVALGIGALMLMSSTPFIIDEDGSSGNILNGGDDPGTIAGGAVAYYGPVSCFGAKAVVFFIRSTDSDSLAAISYEVSNDSTTWYAAAANKGAGAGFVGVDTPVSKVSYAMHSYIVMADGASTTSIGPQRLLVRWIKLKLTASGTSPTNDIVGVTVRPYVVYDEFVNVPQFAADVYSWSTP